MQDPHLNVKEWRVHPKVRLFLEFKAHANLGGLCRPCFIGLLFKQLEIYFQW